MQLIWEEFCKINNVLNLHTMSNPAICQKSITANRSGKCRSCAYWMSVAPPLSPKRCMKKQQWALRVVRKLLKIENIFASQLLIFRGDQLSEIGDSWMLHATKRFYFTF